MSGRRSPASSIEWCRDSWGLSSQVFRVKSVLHVSAQHRRIEATAMNIPDAVEFNIGDRIYLKLCGERVGMIVGICFRPNGVTFAVSWAHDMAERWRWAIELSREKVFSQSA